MTNILGVHQTDFANNLAKTNGDIADLTAEVVAAHVAVRLLRTPWVATRASQVPQEQRARWWPQQSDRPVRAPPPSPLVSEPGHG